MKKTKGADMPEQMRTDGCRAVHLLTAKGNPAAVRTYDHLGFGSLGECFRYGDEYFLCEKVFL